MSVAIGQSVEVSDPGTMKPMTMKCGEQEQHQQRAVHLDGEQVYRNKKTRNNVSSDVQVK